MGNAARGCYIDNAESLIKPSKGKSGTTKRPSFNTDLVGLAQTRSSSIIINKYITSTSRREGDDDNFDDVYYEMRFNHIREKFHSADYIAKANKVEDAGKETRTISKKFIEDKWTDLSNYFFLSFSSHTNIRQ